MTIIPTRVGILKVTAKMGDQASATLDVVAYREQTATVKLPFVGEGYVAFAALLLIVPAALMLLLTKNISSDAVVGLLSGAIGVAFGGSIGARGGAGTNTQAPADTTAPATPAGDS